MGEDLYEKRNSNYCYKDSNVLINKLDIHDEKLLQKYEAKITAAKLLALRQKGIIGNFDAEHLNKIHTYLFEDIYPFAGKYRNENIAKGIFRFAEYEYIEPELQKLMKQLKDENYLSNLSKEKLSERLAYYLSELNVLHPYREGNGRTTREFIRELALKNGLIYKGLSTIQIIAGVKENLSKLLNNNLNKARKLVLLDNIETTFFTPSS